MEHNTIILENLGIAFPSKECFTGFSAQICYGDRIGIVGANGSGKTSLLKIIAKQLEPHEGRIIIPKNSYVGYLPQIIDSYDSISGGERFNKELTKILSNNHNVLLLDEPTNHLDKHNRNQMIRFLKNLYSTLIISSHDVNLLNNCTDIIWHINEGSIQIFKGGYKNFLSAKQDQESKIIHELQEAKKQKQHISKLVQKEQKRSSQSRKSNSRENDRKLLGALREKGSLTAGRKNQEVRSRKEAIEEKMHGLRLPEIIKPKFTLPYHALKERMILSISQGAIGYSKGWILEDINLFLNVGDRVALLGANGSGKSSLVRAILDDPKVKKQGTWQIPKKDRIGYLDQHYLTLDPNKTVFDTIKEFSPFLSDFEVRDFLNSFLFKKNEQVNSYTHTLSGGEKARLSLAKIAAQQPSILILDELTNNLDLETKEHVYSVLNAFPGTLFVISHEKELFERIGIERGYCIQGERIEELNMNP